MSSASKTSLERALDEVLALLHPAQDILNGRPREDRVPEWCVERGWDAFLSELSRADFLAAEQDPASWFARSDAPSSLRELASRAAFITSPRDSPPAAVVSKAPRHIKQRKWAQLSALCVIAAHRFEGVSRVVDLGSGHGHLTRALARTLNSGDSVGVDWDDDRIARAIALSDANDDSTSFVRGDGTANAGELRSGDLVSGLHPCGALGDALIRRARDAKAHVLAVSCCYQKTPSDRQPLSTQARDAGFVIPRATLGLANLSPRSFQGSGTLSDKRRGRRTRLALRLLLEARGLTLTPGDEGRGLTKEKVRHGLEVIAPLACESRGLTLPTASEIADATERAKRAHAQIARFALPRHILARVLELGVVLDRARYLEEAGWRTEVIAAFPKKVSPRNLAIVARAPTKK